MLSWLPPGAILMVGALLIPFLRGKARMAWMLSLPIAGAVQIGLLYSGNPELSYSVDVFGMTLELVRVDKLSLIFGLIFHLAALIGVLYALRVERPRDSFEDSVQDVAQLAYAGSAIAAAFAGDLITLFIWWEVTGLTSVFLIWANTENPVTGERDEQRAERSYSVGQRYLVIQVVSGVLLLVGAVQRYVDVGNFHFDHMTLGDVGTWPIFIAFGIKACFPFLHGWMKDAYPEATFSGSVFLSAFTTKLAIYSMARGFPGTELLIPIGATMTAFPIFYAVIENDLRRVLSYSLNNQLGYMLVGIGLADFVNHPEVAQLALNGATAHAFAHILYKGLLFMTMGAVLYRVGHVRASDLGGLYKSMPITTVMCIIGAMAISAYPLFSGFVTKSMILTAAAERHYTVTFLVLLFASAGVVDHSGIKIPFFAFFAHDSGIRVKEAPKNMLIAMGIAAFGCIFIGVVPGPLYALLPFDVGDYSAYDMTHVVTQLQLLLFSAAAFIFLQKAGWYPAELRSLNLDIDWVWRRMLPTVGSGAYGFLERVYQGARAQVERGIGDVMKANERVFSPGSLLGEPWPTGSAALWAGVLLGLYLLLYYA